MSIAQTLAFFDVDGTLIRLKSMLDFLEYAAIELANDSPGWGRRCQEGIDMFAHGEERGMQREEINTRYYGLFRGMPHSLLQRLSRAWYGSLKVRHPNCWIAQTSDALRAHQSARVAIVLVSGSFVDLLRPLADEIGVEHILATSLEIDEAGYLTGGVKPPQMIGRGKVSAIEQFIGSRDVDMLSSFAYGDHHSDIPMLEMVGHATVVGDAGTMVDEATRRGWRVLAGHSS